MSKQTLISDVYECGVWCTELSMVYIVNVDKIGEAS